MSKPDLPPDILTLLVAERQPPPSPPAGARERVLARVKESAAMAAVGTALAGDAPIATAATTTAGGVMSAKVISAVAVAAVLAGSLVWFNSATEQPAAPTAPAAPTVPAPTLTSPVPMPQALKPEVAVRPAPTHVATPTPARPVPVTATARPVADSPPRHSRRALAAAPPAPPRRVEPPSEGALLRDARRAMLSGATGRALGLLKRARKLYPSGGLAEDRGALRVHALMRAGRRDDAQRRAVTFLKRYPRSIHAASLGQLLAPNN